MATERLRVILEMITSKYQSEARQAATATQGIVTSANDLDKRLGGLPGRLSSVSGAMSALAGIGVVAFLKDATQAAADDARQQELLAQVMRNTVGATNEQIDATEQWIDATARATGIADDQLRPAYQNLLTFGMSAADAQRNLAAAMDISAAKGIDLSTVVTAIGKASRGVTGGLGRLGIVVKNVNGEALTFEEIMANAADTMGGAMATAAETAAGKMARAKVAVDELKESVGALLVEGVAGAADDVSRIGSLIQILSEQYEQLAGSTEEAQEESLGFFGFLEQSLGVPEEVSRWLRDMADRTIEQAEAAAAAEDKVLDYNEALEAGIVPGDRLRGVVGDLGDEQEELATEVAKATEQLKEQRRVIREQTDPVFAMSTALDRLNDANRNLVEVQQDSGTSSAEYRDALLDLLGAQRDLEFAQDDLATAFGPDSRRIFEEWASAAGIPLEVLEKILDSILAINNTPLNPQVSGRPVTSRTAAGTGITANAYGGPVWQDQLTLVGERGPELFVPRVAGSIIPNHQLMGGGSKTVNVTVVNPTTHDLPADLQYGTLLAGLAAGVR